MASVFLFIGCSIFILLAVLHASATLFSDKFEPANPELLQALQGTSAKIAKKTGGNMWTGIIGFHLSHSLGMGLFGALTMALQVENPAFLAHSISLNIALFAIPISYILLAQRYWFYIPRNGFIAALACFIGYAFFR